MCFLDFNDELINQVFEFVDELKRDGNASMASLIDNMLLTKLVGISKKKDGHHDSPPPPPIVCVSLPHSICMSLIRAYRSQRSQ
jgi:hypothetical protein